jgi:hypothetical protein
MLILTCWISVGYAQDTTKVSQREIYNEVKLVVKQLAESLQTTSEHVYSILVRQSIVRGVIRITMVGILYLVILVYIVNWNRFYNWGKMSDDYDSSDGPVIIFWLSTVLLAFLFCVSIFQLPSALSLLLNPEYNAINEIMELIGVKKSGCPC